MTAKPSLTLRVIREGRLTVNQTAEPRTVIGEAIPQRAQHLIAPQSDANPNDWDYYDTDRGTE